MRVVAHRGVWKRTEEQNSLGAFQAAARNGFGVELDFRDHLGELIVHHDVPGPDPRTLPLREVLECWESEKSKEPLLLDVKSSGLDDRVARLMSEYPRLKYYLFDAAIPDLYRFHRGRLPFLARWSDLETQPVLADEASGLCVDGFRGDWWSTEALTAAARDQELVLVISPELHGRAHLSVWEQLRAVEAQCPPGKLALCTDFPDEARRFFGGPDRAHV